MNHATLVDIITLKMNGDFALNALRFGFDLYDKDSVIVLKHQDMAYEAVVKDSDDTFNVKAQIDDFSIDVECTCDHVHNPYCAHSAALLYAIRHNRLGEENKTVIQKKPVFEQETEEELIRQVQKVHEQDLKSDVDASIEEVHEDIVEEVIEEIVELSDFEMYLKTANELYDGFKESSEGNALQFYYEASGTLLLRSLDRSEEQWFAVDDLLSKMVNLVYLNYDTLENHIVYLMDELQDMWREADGYQNLLKRLNGLLDEHGKLIEHGNDLPLLFSLRVFATDIDKAEILLNFCTLAMKSWAKHTESYEACLYLKMSLLLEFESYNTAVPKLKDFLGNTTLMKRLIHEPSRSDDEKVELLLAITTLDKASKYPVYRDELKALTQGREEYRGIMLDLVQEAFEMEPTIQGYIDLKKMVPEKEWSQLQSTLMNQLSRPIDYLDACVIEKQYDVLLDHVLNESLDVVGRYFKVISKIYPSMSIGLYQDRILAGVQVLHLSGAHLIQHLDNLLSSDMEAVQIDRYLNRLKILKELNEDQKQTLEEYQTKRSQEKS